MTIAALALSILAGSAGALELTVYNENLGLVRETRPFTLKAGIDELRVEDVAARIDPTSVHFKSLTAPEGVSVLEQNFEYDLISQEKLLEKYLGKEIELDRTTGPNGERKETIKGTLLSNSGGLVLQSNGKVLVNPPGSPVLPALPEGLLTKPTLLWRLKAKDGGRQDCELSYLTEGLGWHSDYVLVASPDDDKADLNAWVTIDNNSGATYKDARLKLVAGDVHRAPQRSPRAVFAKAAMMGGVAGEPQFSEKAFFEYHLYTLERPTTVRESETKQIELASAAEVPVRKRLIFDATQGYDWNEGGFNVDPGYGSQDESGKVQVIFELKNSKENRLGMPLPKGRVRVYKKDSDGALEFVGEDAIDHTPKDETVRVKLGNAFDVVGERKRTDYKSDLHKRWFEETFEIRLRNHKDADASVTVVERLYRTANWKIADASQKWAKKDSHTIEFEVPVKKDGEAFITYTVHYSW